MSKSLQLHLDYRHLLLVVAAAVPALAGVLLTSRIYRNFSWGDIYQQTARMDPPRGSILAIAPADAMGRSMPMGRKLPVFVGKCDSCTAGSFKRERLSATSQISVILVVEDEPDKIPSRLLKLPQTSILADPLGRLRLAANADWLPRMILLDDLGRIEWMQPRPGIYPEGVSYAD